MDNTIVIEIVGGVAEVTDTPKNLKHRIVIRDYDVSNDDADDVVLDDNGHRCHERSWEAA